MPVWCGAASVGCRSRLTVVALEIDHGYPHLLCPGLCCFDCVFQGVEAFGVAEGRTAFTARGHHLVSIRRRSRNDDKFSIVRQALTGVDLPDFHDPQNSAAILTDCCRGRSALLVVA